ncbi:lysozyme-like [Vanessa tameamea]|uniref:Lysozyme n=1 Tax=Vanessa tameamea TaxID=334116 RepID=A0A8B8HHV4_VANTA|nr:lysozyme-like [Vanessa tameamea]
MKCLLALFAIAVIVLQCEGKKFTRCELVHQLRDHGFPEGKLRDWVCLVENESSRTTSKIGKVNKNGSRDYGLFQINDKYWCSNTSTPGKDCNVTCSDLLVDDITKAATCAKKIFKRHGFNAWYGWKNHCQGSLPDISSC